MKHGETVLVTAAAGGTGQFAVQVGDGQNIIGILCHILALPACADPNVALCLTIYLLFVNELNQSTFYLLCVSSLTVLSKVSWAINSSL